MRRIVCAALALCSVALAARLAWGHLMIGLDFEGGAFFELKSVDDERIHRALREVGCDGDAELTRGRVNIRGMTQQQAALFEDALPRASVQYRSVIAPVLSPTLGRPLAVAIATLAALAFALSCFRWRTIAVAVGGWALTVAGCVVMLDAIGGTLNRTIYYGGAMAGLAVAAVALTTPRFRFGWPGWIVAAVVLAVAVLLRTFHDPILRNAGRLALTFAPLWLLLAALAAWLTSDPQRPSVRL